GLIAAPVWLGTRAASGNPAAASLAAPRSVLIPAPLQRSYRFWLRDDRPGPPLGAAPGGPAVGTVGGARPRGRPARRGPPGGAARPLLRCCSPPPRGSGA